ncbi:MAG: alkaline phosphatase family protein [Tepidisphaeraceae bacterium]
MVAFRCRLPVVLAIALLVFGNEIGRADGPATTQASRPRVAIISIDGLRPDLALRAEMPNLRALMRHGAFSFWARTTEMSVTLPSHVSMLTGVVPERHGVLWNDNANLGYPLVTTIFELAKSAGLTTAMVTGKSKFAAIARPGSVDWSFLGDEARDDDAAVAARAANVVCEHGPDVLFVHLANVDKFGHALGWGTAEQLAAINRADAALGMILAALGEDGTSRPTTVIVSADHGGSGRQHGPDDARSRHIPWIISGPGIQKDVDLTRYRELTINTEDTFATVCVILGIPLPEGIDGKPVAQAFVQTELMTTAAAPATQPGPGPAPE